MPRSKLVFWIATTLAIIVPAALALVLFRAGGFAGVALLAVLVGVFVVARLVVTRRFTADLQPRRQPPPERELIAHARRPTLLIGLGILAATLVMMVVIGLTGAGQRQPTLPTPTPDLNLRSAEANIQPQAEAANLLAGFALPATAAVLGTIGLAVLLVAIRRTDRPSLIPSDEPPAAARGSDRPEPDIDWAELLDGDDDGNDLSLWVDSLKGDDRQR